jgi:threonine/homoserine/homoserine lactone efflux protein
MFGISLEKLAAFSVSCAVIELAPGPNMAYLAVVSAGNGRRAGFASVFGFALGLCSVGIGADLGLAANIPNSQFLYEALRRGGMAHLLWLAWDG